MSNSDSSTNDAGVGGMGEPAYSTTSIVVMSVDSCFLGLMACVLGHAVHLLRDQLRVEKNTSATQQLISGSTSFFGQLSIALWLRIAYLGGAICAFISAGIGVSVGLMRVPNSTLVGAAFTDWSSFSSMASACSALYKISVTLYVCTKLFSYLFFFLKQRAVRPMNNTMNNFEKLALIGTVMFSSFLVVGPVLTQGSSNELDGTCQIYLPNFMLICETIADVCISFLYLYLFIQPLRDTIEGNQVLLTHQFQAKQISPAVVPMSVLPTIASVSPATSPQLLPSTTMPEAPPALSTANSLPVIGASTKVSPAVTPFASKRSLSLVAPLQHTFTQTSLNKNNYDSGTLEQVMKRNTICCFISVGTSFLSIVFMLVAHFTNDPHARKWITGIAPFDMSVTAMCLGYVLHKRRNNAQPSPPAVHHQASFNTGTVHRESTQYPLSHHGSISHIPVHPPTHHETPHRNNHQSPQHHHSFAAVADLSTPTHGPSFASSIPPHMERRFSFRQSTRCVGRCKDKCSEKCQELVALASSDMVLQNVVSNTDSSDEPSDTVIVIHRSSPDTQ